MTWVSAVVAMVVSAVGGGGFATIVQAILRRRTDKADAADRLTTASVKWAEEVQADASEARREASEARREATAARREAEAAHHQMRQVTVEAEALAARLRQWRTAILDPRTTLEGLRAMVEYDPPLMNGRTP